MLQKPTRQAYKPLSVLPKAAAQCAEAGRAYGKCIGARYMDVERGMCEREFVQFRQCMVEAMKKARSA
ncbi:hypothetical protein BMF94_1672 [Rhodotorula taiwanensis]|uniref:IMS import disulfide relay-system CHCH-CHCH-like Cx9C domain-containing protein n=1 Tax=Rhodotorula taiwanensis TaxID=741276 RepID=A0A2S5BEW4_9BASI|nr:hypothetical protein BMF94_1672 [Rhodotorula taiwanensis]